MDGFERARDAERIGWMQTTRDEMTIYVVEGLTLYVIEAEPDAIWVAPLNAVKARKAS